MDHRYLTSDELDTVVDAAAGARLTDPANRTLLLDPIDSYLTQNMPVNPAPLLQVRMDLVELNHIERLADGTVPLAQWLAAAVSLTRNMPQQSIFRQFHGKVTAAADGLPPLPETRTLPEVVNNEAIVHEDEMVDFDFLAKGTLAGAAVVKLEIPRFDNGVPSLGAGGSAALFLGTGWLISRDLIVTNHHVINARLQGEPEAVEGDLRLQVGAGQAILDFDSRSAPGIPVKLSAVEAWSSLRELDFAVIRLQEPCQDRSPLPLWQHLVQLRDSQYLPVNIIQHPDGGPKRIAFRNNLMTAADATTIRYFTDTLPGSSGSPVLNDDWTVVALHRGSKQVTDVNFQGRPTATVNFGTQIAAILDRIRADRPDLAREIGV